ncbi:hypothetical protein [Sphingobium agri]|uniref:Uncharacterized protein n=1 Tax=Sphingobium agri TaxID=2933566 RepID=A0ABT0DWJ0_9SPHN|nr:hypothetical protein [Sphingobium agri]MCK0531491.1 hypothetical protein [Sphingobium agri]
MTHPNTDQGVTAEVTQDRYLLVKRGLYYRPGNQGYTGIKEYAGRYPASDASPDDGVTAIHEDEAPEYSQACYHDLMAQHAAGKAAALEAEIASLKQRLESAEDETARLRMDRDRLDFLDRCNQRLNATYGTNYGWQLILNHNVNRLMLEHMSVDLHDSHGGKGKLPSCRAAIDAEMGRLHALQEQEKQNG